MKLPLFLTLLTQLTLASTASADVISKDYAYDFLSGGKIGLCPGVALRVRTVGTVGSTTSGGAHGYEWNWNQAFFDQFRNNGMLRGLYHDIRADIEAQNRGFDFVKAKWSASLGTIVPKPAAMMEQLPVRNAKVSACVSKFDLASVNQDRGKGANGTEIVFDVAVKYSVSLDTDHGRETIPVQVVEGTKLVTSTFFNLYYDYSPRAWIFMQNSWDGLQADIASSLAPVADAEADQGMERVRGYLGEYIGGGDQ